MKSPIHVPSPSETGRTHAEDLELFTSTTPPNPCPPPATTVAPPVQRMTTRAQNNIYKPRKIVDFRATSSADTFTPSTYKQAQKHACWRQAMQSKFDALMNNETWELVPKDS